MRRHEHALCLVRPPLHPRCEDGRRVLRHLGAAAAGNRTYVAGKTHRRRRPGVETVELGRVHTGDYSRYVAPFVFSYLSSQHMDENMSKLKVSVALVGKKYEFFMIVARRQQEGRNTTYRMVTLVSYAARSRRPSLTW